MARNGSTTAQAADEAKALIDEGADGARSAVDEARTTVEEMRVRASEAASHLPEVAATTQDAMREAARRIEAGSDESLAIGAALSLGFGLGLLVGGGNRLLVAAALVPAAAMGMTLLDRRGNGRRVGASTRSS
jgi:hypothetical protein